MGMGSSRTHGLSSTLRTARTKNHGHGLEGMKGLGLGLYLDVLAYIPSLSTVISVLSVMSLYFISLCCRIEQTDFYLSNFYDSNTV